MKLIKEVSTTNHVYTGNHYDGKKIVHTKEFFYDSEEERKEHIKKMIVDGYEADSQIRKTVGSLCDSNYVWFGRYWKIEVIKE